MISVGYWEDPGAVRSPLAWINPRILPTCTYRGRKSRVLDFLRSADVRDAYRGYSHCRFSDCDVPDQEMGFRARTDGVWEWPEGLAHYVGQHDIELPVEFLDYILASGTPPGEDLWVRWSTQFRSFAADPAAATEAQINQLARNLATGVYQPVFEHRGDHWAVFVDDLMVDAVPMRSLEAMEVYLFAHRWGAEGVSFEEARNIVNEARSWSQLLKRPKIVDMNGQPGLRDRTCTAGLHRTDAKELEYRLRISKEDSISPNSVVRQRYLRLWRTEYHQMLLR